MHMHKAGVGSVFVNLVLPCQLLEKTEVIHMHEIITNIILFTNIVKSLLKC